MRIEIEIPKEFEGHFEQDRFEDSLHRLCADAHLIAGNYEKETAIMLIKAFKESKSAYDVEKVVAGIGRRSGKGYRDIDGDYVPPMIATKDAIEIVMNGGKE